MKRLFSLLLCLFLFPVFYVVAQEATDVPASAGAPASDEASEGGSYDSAYIEMDIKTSSLMELAAWCRELNLSEGGAREELAARLRTYYKLPQAKPASAANRVITIESARTTEYFTLDIVDEEYARLRGDVIISLRDGNAVHRIKAWEVLYNRTRNVMTASGKVEYVKEEGDTIETFKGQSITVNMDNWAGIFVDGVVDKSISGNATAYRFAGTVISRNSEEVTVLTGADITNPQSEETFWSIHASKLWLLPGNDFAILNAVLKVGNIPLLYLPFFYYPSDEIVFHPVLGYRSREGTYLQTTTYILGRPRTDAVSENSITKIFGSASGNMDKKREGVFLRTTGEKRTDPNDTRLSVLLDAYVNLGFYLGTELALPRKGPLGEITVSAGLGLTRNIYPLASANTPFAKYDGRSEWNRGMLFSLNTPFRYRFNTTGSYQIQYGSFSWAFPFYSDPYMERDFMKRSEVLDWLAMLREGTRGSAEDETNDTYLSSYEWRVSGSFNPSVSKLNPYISSLSISSVSSSLTFNSRTSNEYRSNANNPVAPPNPGYMFFFPNRFTIFSVSASMAGTPYRTAGSAAAQPKVQTRAPGDSLLPDIPLSPWESPEAQSAPAKAPQDAFTLTPPVLAQRFTLPGAGGPQLSFDYRFTPTAATELQFRSTEKNWKEQEDINWSEVSTVLSKLRGDANLGLNLSHSGGGAYTGAFRLSGTGAYQDYMYLNKDAEEFTTSTDVQAAKNRAYSETYFTSSWDLSASFRPFFRNTVWGGTSLQYNLRGLFAKTSVETQTSADDPDWDWAFGKWNKADISSHQVTANVAANIRDYSQSLSLTAVLPPRDASASAAATLRAWISTTSIRGSIKEPWDDDLRNFDPVYFTETLAFGKFGNFQQYVVLDPEKEEFTTLTSSLKLWGFTASFSAVYAKPYRFDPLFGSGGSTQLWQLQPDERLEPRELKLAYADSFAKTELWGKRLSFSLNVNTSLAFDLQRYTNSRFTFGFGFTLGITNFLEFNFTTYSENAVIYRYFQKLPFFDSPPTDLYSGTETNFFVDLWNSFRFGKPDLRRQSGFKLKSLNLSLLHHL